MKQIKKLLLIFLLTIGISTTNGYVFGIKSADNTISNILEIKERYNLDFNIIGFIFDPRTDDIPRIINNLDTQLGTGKIYHITLAPNEYSAKQVTEGIFDEEYKRLFQTIKNNDLKVIFRTMHEMNGGRYPRGSNPEQFKQARIHVRELSREIGLDQNNILFDFSVNHRDMPTKETPSQSAKLITCNKYKTDCYKFEDYYPGDNYVDIMGVTFYNRGKATYSRQRYSPNKILNDQNWNTLNRLKSFNKPIFVDEVGTTAVWYSGTYNFLKSKIVYDTEYYKKNERLAELNEFMQQNPEIIGMTYFNTDFTNGMTKRTPGEADRAIININSDKIYFGIYDLYNNNSIQDFEKLKKLFTKTKNENNIYLTRRQKKELANYMLEKFGKEETMYRIKLIIDNTKNTDVHKILNDIKDIINEEN